MQISNSFEKQNAIASAINRIQKADMDRAAALNDLNTAQQIQPPEPKSGPPDLSYGEKGRYINIRA